MGWLSVREPAPAERSRGQPSVEAGGTLDVVCLRAFPALLDASFLRERLVFGRFALSPRSYSGAAYSLVGVSDYCRQAGRAVLTEFLPLFFSAVSTHTRDDESPFRVLSELSPRVTGSS